MEIQRENVEPNLDLLLEKIREYNPEGNFKLIRKAYSLASTSHCEQFRKSGEPYFFHPFNVAMILASLRMDNITIAAGLLHDVVEDCSVTNEDIKKKFGNTMALILDGVTKISKLSFKTREEFQAENLRKLLFAIVRDVRVILVKLADRLHNLRTISSLDVKKQQRIASETLDIYVPLANRLGMYSIKSELEDISFRIVEPIVAAELEEMINRDLEFRRRYIDEIVEKITLESVNYDIKCDIKGRSKNLYSIWNKQKNESKELSDIYDLMGVRVVVATLQDCYSVLGLAHRLWRPIPGRFKDYIAMPKMNMYQSLHTTIMHPSGVPVEIQIRTKQMNRIAEEGIAAHWNYKEGQKSNEQVSQEISWLRRLINWHRDLKDAKDYIETIKLELYRDEVFVFTPQGDVKALVMGATPLDFAYLVHTEVGHNCVGAKVNGKIVTLDTPLQNGDIVEVLTSKNGTPSKDWLKVVKSNNTKHKIKAWFKNQERANHLKKGKELFAKEWKEQMKEVIPFYAENPEESPFHKENHVLNKVLKNPLFEKAIKDLQLKAIDNFFVRVGRGDMSLKPLFTKLFPAWAKLQDPRFKLPEILTRKKTEKETRSVQGIIVSGWDDVLVKFGKCCNPLPGDPIHGFITRGTGITIHRTNCKLLNNITEKERFIDVQWDMDFIHLKKARYVTKIRLEALDRPSLLNNVTSLVHNLKLNIFELHAEASKNKLAIIEFSVEVPHVSMLPELTKNLQKIDGVVRVVRIATSQ